MPLKTAVPLMAICLAMLIGAFAISKTPVNAGEQTKRHSVILIDYTMALGKVMAFPDGSGYYREELGMVTGTCTSSEGGPQIKREENLADVIAARMDEGYVLKPDRIYGQLVMVKISR